MRGKASKQVTTATGSRNKEQQNKGERLGNEKKTEQ
jgi:hypothetical protein